MKNVKIFFIVIIGLSLLSCNNDDCYQGTWHPYDAMQRVKLVDKEGNWIEGIDTADLELIAYSEDWKKPLLDKDEILIKQFPGRVEAKKKMNKYNYSGSGVDWIELYMVDKNFFTDNRFSSPSNSHFILRVNNDSFKIRAGYITDFRRINVLQSFFFEGKLYPVGTSWVSGAIDITIPEVL